MRLQPWGLPPGAEHYGAGPAGKCWHLAPEVSEIAVSAISSIIIRRYTLQHRGTYEQQVLPSLSLRACVDLD
jgi:hypothetical protein